MFSKLPLVFDNRDKDFWFNYNKKHAEEHQDMANWINALAEAKNLDLTVTYYQLPPYDPNDKTIASDFFTVNWKQHQMFYDFLNKIGASFTIPFYAFPKNYPSFIYDLDAEAFLKNEKEIHTMLWRAIDVAKSSL